MLGVASGGPQRSGGAGTCIYVQLKLFVIVVF